MKTLFSVLGSIAGIIQSVLTFIVLLELKGMFFHSVCLFFLYLHYFQFGVILFGDI